MDSKQVKLFLKDTNTDVIFILKHEDQLIIKASSRNNPNVFYQNVLTNSILPLPLKNKYIDLKGFCKQMESQGQSKIKLNLTQKQAILSIQLKNNISIPITLSLLQQIQTANPKGKIISKSYENKQLKNLEDQQKQLDQMIKQLEDQVNMLKVTETQKDVEVNRLETQKGKLLQHLDQVNHRFEQNKKKFVSNQIDFDQKYGKYIEDSSGKHRLFMKQKGVTDEMIKEIVVFDLRKIQILSLGDNKITDIGFNLLFTDKKWPVLIQLFLQNNKIENIHSLQAIQSLQTLSLYQNELSKQSCDYLCKYTWVNVKGLRVSFKKGINNECWKKLLQKLGNNFPSLKELWYSNEDDLTGVMKKRIFDYCSGNSISLNHSLGGSGNGLEEIIKLKLLADLLKGGITITK